MAPRAGNRAGPSSDGTRLRTELSRRREQQAAENAELEVTGTSVALPTTVDHAVYRIVQEALTNTRKHASSARSRVRLTYLPELVEVEVADDGTGGPAGPRLGLGLAGMAERVSLCGGELKAGPAPFGGFVVHARIPLTEQA
ncbi:sensor histidine kinase [Nonomuraea zeae]|uniref:histidine kinase n=1 Tax=Nonomuraea zeae TaxID=1642303 RepID=A0A5S4GSU0_9ACTN|nr:ATP-binding protein [Nonomuraea zeae]TMR29470.1 hypothetical protein ETD85_32260 [Nonomuraea zeae]